MSVYHRSKITRTSLPNWVSIPWYDFKSIVLPGSFAVLAYLFYFGSATVHVQAGYAYGKEGEEKKYRGLTMTLPGWW